MVEITRLENCVMPYPWGSRTVLAAFLGQRQPAPEPQAEMWMGAHPKAPSCLEWQGEKTALDALIRRHPAEVLGEDVARRFGGELPFLLKVLAAERALSIQAHPDRAQAAAGFARENAAGVADEQRNYRDVNHKPEILYALEPFSILRGFREPEDVRASCARVGLAGLLPDLPWAAEGEAFLKGFFRHLADLPEARIAAAIQGALARIEADGLGGDPLLRWLPRLAEQFPGDRGILAPLYLHVVQLAAGEAIFTGPGILHAYLEGVGVELMANSDNVLRGGLTTKHVDVAELVKIVRCEPQPPVRLQPGDGAQGSRLFRAPVDDFALEVLEPAGPRELATRRGVEILFCGRGEGRVAAAGQSHACRQGDSFLIPAALPAYTLEGPATFFRATAG